MPDFKGTGKMDYNPCVILVFSNCMSVIEAKLTVSKGYKGTKYPDTFYIHHEYDDNDDVSKLSAFCKASFIYDKIKSMTNNISKTLIFHIVHEEIRKLLDGRYGEIAVKHSDVNIEHRKHEHYEMNTVDGTMKRTCKFLGMIIEKRLASFSVRQSFIPRSIAYEICDNMLFEAMKVHVIFEFGERRIFEGNPFQLIREKEDDILRTLKNMYDKTLADLENVCLTLKKLKKRCRPRNMSECKYFLVCIKLLFLYDVGYACVSYAPLCLFFILLITITYFKKTYTYCMSTFDNVPCVFTLDVCRKICLTGFRSLV